MDIFVFNHISGGISSKNFMYQIGSPDEILFKLHISYVPE